MCYHDHGSHQHVNSSGGGMIIIESNPQTAILEFSQILNHNASLNLGSLNWVQQWSNIVLHDNQVCKSTLLSMSKCSQAATSHY